MVTKTKVVCIYEDKCTDIDSELCKSCIHNEKKSYYQPIQPVYWPWYPVYPYWPTTTPELYRITYTGDTALELKTGYNQC